MCIVQVPGLQDFVPAAQAENTSAFHVLDVSKAPQLIICRIIWVCLLFPQG